jgi:hypothetical protein
MTELLLSAAVVLLLMGMFALGLWLVRLALKEPLTTERTGDERRREQTIPGDA